MVTYIDLNAELGESEDPDDIARDIALMAYISSANIACGGHAGSERTMHAMLHAAKAHDLAIGAHPSYPDRANFGRISMEISLEELAASLKNQIHTLSQAAAEYGITLRQVKPHGALYNDAANDPILASFLANIIAEAVPGAAFVGLAGSAMADAAQSAQLHFVAEAFLDRRYTAAARLVPRNQTGAVIAANTDRVAQALALAKGAIITANDGSNLSIAADSLCLHSDSPDALKSAAAIRSALENANVRIAAPK